MKLRNGNVEVTMSEEMVEQVISEWQEEHPSQDAMQDMSGDEFMRRLMIEINASFRLT